MRCPNCLTENPPTAIFCIECGNRLVVCPNCGMIILPTAKFCIECGTKLTPTSPPTSESRLLQPVKTARTPHSSEDGSKIRLTAPEERRIVTIMFADITGSTPLADKLDPEATRLQMRIGINTGEVAAPGAQFSRRDFLITGDAVNIAARLQQVAMPDMILVGERTYHTTRDVFEFRPLAPLSLKGKPDPIHAWVVQDFRHGRDATGPNAIIQHPRGIEGLEAPLVGRDLELTLMHATYARVQAEKHSHLITLLGTPGIGKSRLVRDFIAREQEAAKCTSCDESLSAPRVLQGRCPP